MIIIYVILPLLYHGGKKMLMAIVQCQTAVGTIAHFITY